MSQRSPATHKLAATAKRREAGLDDLILASQLLAEEGMPLVHAAGRRKSMASSSSPFPQY